MNYTVETIQQSLLDQGITEVHIGEAVYPVASTNPRALLYIVIYNGLKEEQPSFSSSGHDYLGRTVQSLQMFGDPFMISLVEGLAAGSES